MAFSQMTFESCFEDCADLGWFGTFPALGALIASLTVFKDSNITVRFLFGWGEQTANLREEIMKCRWPTMLK